MNIKHRLCKITKLGIALTAISTLLLTGCGGGGGGATGSNSPVVDGATSELTGTTLSGVAAVGAPIVNGTINISCAAGAAVSSVSTSSTGTWQANLSGQTLPCAVQVSGGNIGTATGAPNTTPYHSIALTAGTVNVTPLTDMLMANVVGTDSPSTWVAGLNNAPGALSGITQSKMDAALANMRTAMYGLTPIASINPITASFTAVPGNVVDNMLVALKTAIDSSGVSYQTHLKNAAVPSFNMALGFSSALKGSYVNISSASYVTTGATSTGGAIGGAVSGGATTGSTGGTLQIGCGTCVWPAPGGIHPVIQAGTACTTCHASTGGTATSGAVSGGTTTGSTGGTLQIGCGTCVWPAPGGIHPVVQAGTACTSCHASTGGLPATFNHAGVGSGTCSTCHAAQRPSSHAARGYLASCDTCHTIGSKWVINRSVNHSLQQGKHTCNSCHSRHNNSTPCDTCHTVNSWGGAEGGEGGSGEGRSGEGRSGEGGGE